MDNKLIATLAAAGVAILEFDRILITIAAAGAACKYLSSFWNTFDPYYGDGGQARYTQFLLEEVRPDLFRKIVRMERTTFNSLVEELKVNRYIKDGRSVSAEEQVLIFLDIVCHNNHMRETAVKFRRGLYTIQRYFAQVLDSLVAMYPNYVKFDMDSCKQPSHVAQNPKYRAFKHARGALDGVFVPAAVPTDQQSPWRNRKGFLAQNVLAAVNFNFEFVYVLAGWEGSAHDTQVFNDATSKGLKIPLKSYFLADAGYGLRQGLMTPFRGIRYHLKEQAIAGKKPSNTKELYNLRHATLRNIVEQIFGCIKRKFSILQAAPEIELKKQVRLIYALCMLWNFIRSHESIENMFDDPAEDALTYTRTRMDDDHFNVWIQP
ncbi:hypothetical protein PSTG_03355 [Puccinia striiformis f. sp. tritici PST-78]|uniref:Uncharacterized protein n=1 Tax=Puccinia striiformis f. sp. tritici PST-78 TaxID=1165861 RepID=A0A0L0VWP4_9BASI|nr:hypothetical protein PSTG_03355 [Puccinia striiformis f. sp. tritici PST-78]